jgi:hypothetical protein
MGKSSVVYVIGLSLIIGIALANINDTSMESMDTYATYFGRTMAHNVAITAANVATHNAMFNAAFTTAFTGSFAGGQYSVTYNDTGSGATLTRFINATSHYAAGGELIRDTVRAILIRTMFSRYGWFTEREQNGYVSPSGVNGPYYGASDWKITGDSVFGFAHTNGKFNLGGRPYFDKKVTATNSPTLMFVNGEKDPIYNEGYEWGVTINRDTANIGTLKALSNTGNPFAALFSGNDVGMEFFSGGTVRVRVPHNTGALLDSVVPVSMLATSKVVGVNGGDLHLKGTYTGQMTLAAFKGASGASTNKGNVWIDGDLVASDNPRFNPSSSDMFGIVAERMGYITRDNTRTTSSVLNIQAAIYCHDGEFTAQEFWQIGKHGRVSLFGSLTQKTAGSLGVFSSSGLQNGFYYSIRHDTRFLSLGPPAFPFSTKFRLVAWWEN